MGLAAPAGRGRPGRQRLHAGCATSSRRVGWGVRGHVAQWRPQTRGLLGCGGIELRPFPTHTCFRRLRFPVSVPITDDAHEDDGETFRLRLSNPEGARLRDGEREATGTIRNSDPEATPLTASFEGVPSEHDGESAFTFRVAFSEDIGISFKALREDAFTVTGGRVTGGTRVDGRRDLFRMT